jgi:hypothetical protein
MEPGGERRARLLFLLIGCRDRKFGTKRICEACAEATGVSGAGIMLMADDAQLDVSVRSAVVRLRAYSFGNDRPLTEVAKDVVPRKLRFDAASGQSDPAP